MYGLAFFHGVVLERRRYGPVGWNDCYDFSRADLSISLRQLYEMFLQNGEVNYHKNVLDRQWNAMECYATP